MQKSISHITEPCEIINLILPKYPTLPLSDPTFDDYFYLLQIDF